MTRDLRIRYFQFREPIEQCLPEAVAFFRMELDTHHTACPDDAGETLAMARRCPDMLIGVAPNAVAMREVKTLLLARDRQQRIVLYWGRYIPAHMRNSRLLRAWVETNNIGGDNSEARHAAFLASAAEQLRAEANAEQRMTPIDRVMDEVDKAALGQRPRAEVEGAYSRENQPIPFFQGARRVHQLRIDVKSSVHGSHCADITDPAIKDINGHS